MKNTSIQSTIYGILVLLLASCASIPKGATPVSPFDASKYLGQWYEIARLDFSHERGLDNTTANYSLKENGMLKVLNRGYKKAQQEWTESEGKAKFRGDNNMAALKVSFFGPFYTGYNVIELDPDYKYALVVGKNTKYMWFLSREKTMPEDIKEKYLKTAENIGFRIEDLIWVAHDKD